MVVVQVVADALDAAVVLVVVEAVAVVEAALDVVAVAAVALDAAVDAADVAEADNQIYIEEEISGGFAQVLGISPLF